MMNTNNNYMDNINNNLQTNNVGYNNSNINDSVSNNVMMNNTVQNSNSNLNNNKNNDFKTLEGALNMFKNVNFVGNSNCIFVAYNADYAPNPNSALRLSGVSLGSNVGGVGGAIGGYAVGSFLSNSINSAMAEYIKKINNPSIQLLMNVSDFCGYLINITEFGFGFIPLMNNYSSITKIKNVEIHPEFFVSVKRDDIFDISIKRVKLPFMCARIFMKIIFNSGDLTPKPKLSLRIHTKLNAIEYQTINSNNLINMFKK